VKLIRLWIIALRCRGTSALCDCRNPRIAGDAVGGFGQLGFGMARRGEAAPRRGDGRRLATAGGRLRGLGIAWSSGGSQEIDAQGAAHVVTIRQLPINHRSPRSWSWSDRALTAYEAICLAPAVGGSLGTLRSWPQPRGGGSGLDRRGGKDGAWGRGNTAGCDPASESRIKVRLRDATPMRSIGMLDLREVLSAFGVEDEVMPQGRRYLRISCEVDIGIEAGFPRRDQCPSCTLTTT